jgi:hypothetical protein
MNFSLPHFLFALIVAAVLGLGMGGEAQTTFAVKGQL